MKINHKKKFLGFAGKYKAFTLAEVTTVVVVLGILVAIIIPNAIRRHIEIVKRTKIKKALASYEALIHRMIIENDLRSETALDNWAVGNGDCAPARQYFKIVETYNANPCIFKTTDGLWWYIDSGEDVLTNGTKKVSLSRAIVSFDLETNQERNLRFNQSVKERLYLKAAREDWKDTFYFVTSFDANGSPRISDIAYGQSADDMLQVGTSIKVYSFINKNNFNDYWPICSDTQGTNCCDLDTRRQTIICKGTDGKHMINRNISCGKSFFDTSGQISSFQICSSNSNETALQLPACEEGGYGCWNELNPDNYRMAYYGGCSNMIGDNCEDSGTVRFYDKVSVDVIGGNATIIDKLQEALGENFTNLRLKSSETEYYGCPKNLNSLSQCTNKGWLPDNGYAWVSGQKVYRYIYEDKNGNQKELTLVQKPAGNWYVSSNSVNDGIRYRFNSNFSTQLTTCTEDAGGSCRCGGGVLCSDQCDGRDHPCVN